MAQDARNSLLINNIDYASKFQDTVPHKYSTVVFYVGRQGCAKCDLTCLLRQLNFVLPVDVADTP
jgi:hypothetical protein